VSGTLRVARRENKAMLASIVVALFEPLLKHRFQQRGQDEPRLVVAQRYNFITFGSTQTLA
jgi:hypothetical protein